MTKKENTESKNSEIKPEVNEEIKPVKKPSAAKLQQEVDRLTVELETSKNEYFKAYADTENLKKRLQNEHLLLVKYRVADLALDLLPCIDNLERALSEAQEDDPLAKGVKMVYDQLLVSLAKEGVQAIEALNQPFDASLHQAIQSGKSKGVKPGTVIQELQKGYMLKDRILRASLVKVSE